MGNANEPRRMTPRGNSARERVYDDATGDAGRDGYTRLARREPRGRDKPNDDPFAPVSMYGSDDIQPQVGERDWNRGPRFSED